MVQYKRIGEMLLESGLITQKQLDQAMQTKMESTLRFGEILTALGFVDEEQVTKCLADQYGYKVADLTYIEPEPQAVAIIPSITALSGLVLPVKVTTERFYCIIADPLDIPLTDSLFRAAGKPVEFSLAPPSELFDAIVKAYNLAPRARLAGQEIAAKPKRTRKVSDQPKPKRKMKIDPQDDKQALLAALGGVR